MPILVFHLVFPSSATHVSIYRYVLASPVVLVCIGIGCCSYGKIYETMVATLHCDEVATPIAPKRIKVPSAVIGSIKNKYK